MKLVIILWYRKVYNTFLTTENNLKLLPKVIFLLLLFVFINQAKAGDLRKNSQKEIITQDDKKTEMTKRLTAMDKALTQIKNTAVQEIKSGVLAHSQITTIKSDPAGKKLQPEAKISSPAVSFVKRRGIPGWLFLPAGLALVSGLGILIIRYLRYKWKAEYDSELAKIKLRLQEKEERLNQEEVIRNAIEQAQMQKEKDYEQLKNSKEFLKLELQQKNEVLKQKEAVIEEKEQVSLEKEEKCQELEKTVEALKDLLVKKKMMGKFLSSGEDDKPWIPGESAERRELWRVDLSRDYNRTVLLRIDSDDKSKTTKCFAGNISLGGLRFESGIEFEKKEILSLRLFFFGDKVPMMRIKAEVVWIRRVPPVNYYGLSLLSQEEKNKAELNEYIELHKAKSIDLKGIFFHIGGRKL